MLVIKGLGQQNQLSSLEIITDRYKSKERDYIHIGMFCFYDVSIIYILNDAHSPYNRKMAFN